MTPSVVSGCPSLIQVTVVAGEPVDVQVRKEDKDPTVNAKLVICGEAAHVGIKHEWFCTFTLVNYSKRVTNFNIEHFYSKLYMFSLLYFWKF